MTCGDVYYNVSLSQASIGENFTANKFSCVTGSDCSNVPGMDCSGVPELNCTTNVTGSISCNISELNNTLRNVTITVAAIDRVGKRNDSVVSVLLLEPESKFV